MICFLSLSSPPTVSLFWLTPETDKLQATPTLYRGSSLISSLSEVLSLLTQTYSRLLHQAPFFALNNGFLNGSELEKTKDCRDNSIGWLLFQIVSRIGAKEDLRAISDPAVNSYRETDSLTFLFITVTAQI
ncbi:hypothetical protein RRG08_022529 [Elysia crispata]|uniref:Uncharacterized protein n=1 Tax=Elysia crispata TaxID=231223 RepID=A0AAE0Z1Z1_9GAST|nr:hypothetical protein RRG08_022529 [Elysia crispata]